MSELWHCLILLGVLEVFWFYATLIIFVDNNNNNKTDEWINEWIQTLAFSTWGSGVGRGGGRGLGQRHWASVTDVWKRRKVHASKARDGDIWRQILRLIVTDLFTRISTPLHSLWKRVDIVVYRNRKHKIE